LSRSIAGPMLPRKFSFCVRFVERFQEGERIALRLAVDQVRERLRDDAHGLGVVAALGEFRLRGVQHLHRVGDLLLVGRPIEPHERGDRADLRQRVLARFGGSTCGSHANGQAEPANAQRVQLSLPAGPVVTRE